MYIYHQTSPHINNYKAQGITWRCRGKFLRAKGWEGWLRISLLHLTKPEAVASFQNQYKIKHGWEGIHEKLFALGHILHVWPLLQHMATYIWAELHGFSYLLKIYGYEAGRDMFSEVALEGVGRENGVHIISRYSNHLWNSQRVKIVIKFHIKFVQRLTMIRHTAII